MNARYSTRLDAAVALALDSFRTRVRKGTGIPYVTHLFAVMVTVGEYGGDEDQLIAAVLHDWLEDIPGASVEHLETSFGPRVAAMVRALSDSVEHPKPPWRERKEGYLAALRAEPAELKLISAADKLHNCASIRRDLALVGEALWGRFTGGREGTLWYYEAVTAALGAGWDHPLLRRLQDEVQLLHRDAEALRSPPPPRVEVVVCQTGLGRHDPALGGKLAAVGGRMGTTECFDRCETCEIFLLARVDGAMMRFRGSEELVEAVRQLAADDVGGVDG